MEYDSIKSYNNNHSNYKEEDQNSNDFKSLFSTCFEIICLIIGFAILSFILQGLIDKTTKNKLKKIIKVPSIKIEYVDSKEINKKQLELKAKTYSTKSDILTNKRIILHPPSNITFPPDKYVFHVEINKILFSDEINFRKTYDLPKNMILEFQNGEDKDFPDIIIQPKSKIYKFVIFLLHGMKNTSKDFAKYFFKGINIENIESTKIVFIQSPFVQEHLFMGRVIYWYGLIPTNDGKYTVEKNQLDSAYDYVRNYIDKEIPIVGASNILLGGHSMGGAFSYILGLRLGVTIKAIMIMNSVFEERIKPNINENEINIFLAEGMLDSSSKTKKCFNFVNHILEFPNSEVHFYEDGPHKFCDSEYRDLENFINRMLK